MAVPRLKSLVIGTMRADVVHDSLLRLEGRVTEGSQHSIICQYLREVHTYAVEARLPDLTVDVSSLVFVNSSVIRLFVELASRARQAGYTLIFEIDASVSWHSMNFSALRTLVPEIVVREAGPNGELRPSRLPT
jgi:hypothetical protein